MFQYILRYLRTDRPSLIPIKDPLFVDCLLLETEYFGLDELHCSIRYTFMESRVLTLSEKMYVMETWLKVGKQQKLQFQCLFKSEFDLGLCFGAAK